MTKQHLSEAQIGVWRRFLAAHQRVSRRLEADLLERHGLALSEYDVLVQLAEAPDRRRRNVELARAVLLTRSGVTRIVQRLEGKGLVERCANEDDRRGALVQLTDAGLDALRAASGTHLRGVGEMFVEPFDDGELEALGRLLERLEP